jgi:hypothetical protein
VQVSGGGLLNGGGTDLSASIGYRLTRRLTADAAAELIHIPSDVHLYDNGYSVSRGASMRFVSGAIRVVLLPSRRASPYALAGIGVGTSHPNVNQYFRDSVTNTMRVAFAGGGLRFEINPRVSVIADMRFGILNERDEVGLLLPLRAGVAWHF